MSLNILPNEDDFGKPATAIRVLGGRIHPLSIAQWNEVIANAISVRQQLVICSQNLHSLYLLQRSVAMQELQSLALMHVDGMPLIWIARILGFPVNRTQRVTWVDWIDPLMSRAATSGWRVYYVGSAEEIATAGIRILKDRHPELHIAYSHGYFNRQSDSDENQKVIARIREYDPQVLIVGMGMPIQEEWLLQNLSRLPPSAILTSGAAMEYVAGTASTPPRWLGAYGLEWLYRLVENPGRFWKRYIIEPWSLLPLLFRDFFGKSKY